MIEEKVVAIKEFVKNANIMFGLDSLSELVEFLEEHSIESRICSECGHIMVEGYCIEGGEEYYCTDKCLEANMTREEFDFLYNNGDGESYWTEWV